MGKKQFLGLKKIDEKDEYLQIFYSPCNVCFQRRQNIYAKAGIFLSINIFRAIFIVSGMT